MKWKLLYYDTVYKYCVNGFILLLKMQFLISNLLTEILFS